MDGSCVKDAELEVLLAKFPELKLQTTKGTVVCSLSSHEMPGRAEVVRAYVEGRKFLRLKAENDFNFDRLQPYIVPSQKRQRKLFCALTNRYMNRKPAEVELHLRGKRYKRALDDYNAGRLSLFEERLGKWGSVKGADSDEESVGMKEEGTEMDGATAQESPQPPAEAAARVSGRKRKAKAAVAVSEVSAKRTLNSSPSQKKKIQRLK